MPDNFTIEHVCPHLRSRKYGKNVALPAEDNYCALTSSIHLPRPHQTHYCLGGNFQRCTRYQRQGNRPIPRYVRGARPAAITTSEPPAPLRPLPWRYPWVRPALKWLLVAALLVLFVQLWRWRMAQTPAFVVQRDPTPSVIITVTPEPPEIYLRPTAGPPPW